MSTLTEQFESLLLTRAAQINGADPESYAAGYLLSLVKSMVRNNPSLEDTIKQHITCLEYTVAANADSNDDTVYFY